MTPAGSNALRAKYTALRAKPCSPSEAEERFPHKNPILRNHSGYYETIMLLIDYINRVNQLYQTGISTEHSFRGILDELLRSIDTTILVNNETTLPFTRIFM
jgi:hypothetical protein